MGRIMKPFDETKCKPWTEGLEVGGFYVEALSIPKASSRKIIFDNSKGVRTACWETAGLAIYVAQFKPGNFYAVKCNGKKPVTDKEGKQQMAWDFTVMELDESSEIERKLVEWAFK